MAAVVVVVIVAAVVVLRRISAPSCGLLAAIAGIDFRPGSLTLIGQYPPAKGGSLRDTFQNKMQRAAFPL